MQTSSEWVLGLGFINFEFKLQIQQKKKKRRRKVLREMFCERGFVLVIKWGQQETLLKHRETEFGGINISFKSFKPLEEYHRILWKGNKVLY